MEKTQKNNKETQIVKLFQEGKKAKEIKEITNAHLVYIYKIKGKMKNAVASETEPQQSN